MLKIDTDALSQQEQIEFFGKEYAKVTINERLTFVQETDYEFSFDFLLHLDLDTRYKYLKKGEYALHVTKNSVEVLLTLSMSLHA